MIRAWRWFWCWVCGEAAWRVEYDSEAGVTRRLRLSEAKEMATIFPGRVFFDPPERM